MKDGLECGCGAKWGVGGLLDIKDGRVREEIGRRLGEGMGGRHEAGCGWRVLSCPGTSTTTSTSTSTSTAYSSFRPVHLSLYSKAMLMTDDIMSRLRNTLHIPIASNIAPLAITLPTNLDLRSCLSEKQSNNLTFALSRYTAPTPTQAELAFFGWTPHPLSTEIISCRICQRRLGLWAFPVSPSGASETSGRIDSERNAGLDSVGEHLSWCPLGIAGWWEGCALLKGGRGNIGDLTISKDVKRRKWIKAKNAA